MAFAAVGGEEAEWQDIVLSDEEFEEILSNNPDNQITPLSSDLINRHSIAIQKRNQVKNSIIAPDFEPYLLRHTFCTDCQAAGVPINVAKEWMGHSDISVTAKIYTHMVDEVFEQNRMRMAQYAVTKSQQVESSIATN